MNAPALPCAPDQIEEFLARPTAGVIETLSRIEGDVCVLGAGGKMGPTVAIMAAEAAKVAGTKTKVHAVSRFSNPASRELLEAHGVGTLSADLLDREALHALPDFPNILFLAGQKFGTGGSPEQTWAMNTLVPANVAERYADSRIVAFSTGCVYPFAPVLGGGSRENEELAQVGDYANSAIARERTFTFFSKKNGTRVLLFRLNYSIDFRYGVLVDVAQKVLAGEPLDVTMGHANVIWQGDASARAIQCLEHAASPARPLNITGPETISLRSLALRFGELFGKEPVIAGIEAPQAWLNNAAESFALFGYPAVSLEEMIVWVAAWLQSGGATLGKPTHFETRDGKF